MFLSFFFFSCHSNSNMHGQRMKIGENILFLPVESTKDADGIINLTDEAGDIRGMITYSNGMKDGPAKNYYSTGRKSDTLHYQLDLLDGHWTHWDSVGRIESIVKKRLPKFITHLMRLSIH